MVRGESSPPWLAELVGEGLGEGAGAVAGSSSHSSSSWLECSSDRVVRTGDLAGEGCLFLDEERLAFVFPPLVFAVRFMWSKCEEHAKGAVAGVFVVSQPPVWDETGAQVAPVSPLVSCVA